MTNSAAEVIMLFVYSVNLLCRMFSLEVAATVMDALFQFLSYLSDLKRNIFYLTKKILAPNVGLEPTTLRLRVSCSTD